MCDQQDDRQAMDRISKSRESCHPVKKPNRDLSDMGGNKTVKRLWLSTCPRKPAFRKGKALEGKTMRKRGLQTEMRTLT
jgi:hypothetical protein